MNPDGQSCGTCRYWVFTEEVMHPPAEDEPPVPTRLGYCRRYPPTPVGDDGYGYRPNTHSGFWCGEWSPTHPDTFDATARLLALAVLTTGCGAAARALADRVTELGNS